MADAVLLENRETESPLLTIDKPKTNQLSAEVFETMRKHLDAIEMDKNTPGRGHHRRPATRPSAPARTFRAGSAISAPSTS